MQMGKSFCQSKFFTIISNEGREYCARSSHDLWSQSDLEYMCRMKTWSKVEALLGGSRCVCGRSWAVLGPLWTVFGGDLGPLWAVLGISQGPCGLSWAVLGPLWAVWGVYEADKWPKSEQQSDLGRDLGPLWAVLGGSRGLKPFKSEQESSHSEIWESGSQIPGPKPRSRTPKPGTYLFF